MVPPGMANLDYWIALEYDGPPVSYELPRINLVDLPGIPTTQPVSDPLGLGNARAGRAVSSMTSVAASTASGIGTEASTAGASSAGGFDSGGFGNRAVGASSAGGSDSAASGQ
ncbi:hypothetical protein GUJ93_ZPchr0004g39243 [Zizania palustris]|uniref:Uncharacterized protein n=1 Tax=Zizania palustris TaxID=103762 RepID=A0A8J5VZR6_ZIZPA|nr:hypothetical protein GUJ93_ZPchr0004g39243 [Zizania palustris]